jgi:hypothetical protein
LSAESRTGSSFSSFQTEHATVFAELGVADGVASEVGRLFEIGYRVVSQDFEEAARRPQLYVYLSEDNMYQDLMRIWGYPEWIRNVHTVPRMHRDYVEWIPPQRYQDAAFITHEYCHRIIEQMAGLNSQVTFKWFDEGLAEFEAQRALERLSPQAAALRKAARNSTVVAARRSRSLMSLSDLSTEKQWASEMESGPQLAYNESWAAIDYLISRYGIAHVTSVLRLIGTGKAFGEAFRTTYGLNVDEYEAAFRLSLPFVQPGI